MVQSGPLQLADRAIEELESLGAHIEEISVPALDVADAAALAILLGEGYAFHERSLRECPELYGEMNRAEFRVGGLFSMTEYVQAQRARRVLKAQFADALSRVDVIASPTFAVAAPRRDAGPGTAQLHGPIQPDGPSGDLRSMRADRGGTSLRPSACGRAVHGVDDPSGGLRLRAGVGQHEAPPTCLGPAAPWPVKRSMTRPIRPSGGWSRAAPRETGEGNDR